MAAASVPYHLSGPATDADLPELLAREWIETNGLGGYASSTICGANTRRYHAVLVAATRPPHERMALVSKLQETLIVGDEQAELSTDLYHENVTSPCGFKHLCGFRHAPAPTWTFRGAGVGLRKTLLMIPGRNLTVVEYRLDESSKPAALDVRLLVSGRDHHAVVRANDAWRRDARVTPGLLYLPLYDGVPSVWVGHDARAFRPEGTWYWQFDYPRERERGLEDREDLLSAGTLRFELLPGCSVHLALGTESTSVDEAAELMGRELVARTTWPLSAASEPLLSSLGAVTPRFIAHRANGSSTVIAGYPWFTDWGRDTFISLPGLALATGRFEIARALLKDFAEYVSEGMIPNRFPEGGGAAEYNTIDATLWYVVAAYRYACYTGDLGLLRDGLFEVLRDIISWHVRGTRYGIQVDQDGLLTGGADGIQLTWMDAKVDGEVVTPRRGKPVEIAALWYSAQRAVAALARALGDDGDASALEEQAALTAASFNEKFWNPDLGCLYDVLGSDGADASLRPNQLFAVSLPFPVLAPGRQAAVVDVIERRLLTPIGLRTLDPADPRYRGRFAGTPRERDHAYHQGSVWPWLMGPFVSAYVRSRNGAAAARQRMRGILESLGEHLYVAGLGSLCEVADGDPPHRPGGCYFQAWSVAEPLRAFWEDVLDRGPRPI